MEDKFEITMDTFEKRVVRFQVEVYYRSEVVIRFRLTAGKKEMKLEKRLLQKTSQWKILSLNYKLEIVNDFTTRDMFKLFQKLDEIIKGKPKFS